MTRAIPFSIVAPATIVFFGAAVAFLTIVLGVQELRARAETSAQDRAAALSTAMAHRVNASPKDTNELLFAAARSSECTLLIESSRGVITHAAPHQPLSLDQLRLVSQTSGRLRADPQDLFFHRVSLANQGSLIALVARPEVRDEENSLVSSVATFAVMLLALAGFVGWALARDVHADVLYVRDHIAKMAKENSAPEAKAIPVRTIDQVGQLTASFNVLLERFRAAERAYRQDLSQARDFERDRAAFLSALSHELRTPLNAILGFADVLLDEIDGPLSEDARENLTIVRTSGEHLRSLIDDILALSALESGEFRLSREQLDLYLVAQDVVTEARVTAAQKGLRIELFREAPTELTTAYADRRRMRQILGNIISNAVKFTAQGGIFVRVFHQGDFVGIAVTDTGPGIAEQQLEAIFEEFQQAESRKAQRMGTGLGLSITRRLVQLHGGTVRAESILGEGSTFTVRIPVGEPTTTNNLPKIINPETNPIIFDS